MTSDLAAQVATLAARIEALEVEVSELRRALPVANGMGAVHDLAQLLPAIADRMGSEPFTAADLLDDAVLRPLLGGRSAKALGKAFGRAEGAAIAGHVVRRDPRERNTWKIFRSI